jgi:hypothetical protein
MTSDEKGVHDGSLSNLLNESDDVLPVASESDVNDLASEEQRMRLHLQRPRWHPKIAANWKRRTPELAPEIDLAFKVVVTR